MSIPGLGQIPAQAVEATTRVLNLRPLSEWRFQVAPGAAISVRILSGTAEKDGIELAVRNAYRFSSTKSRITTFHGCEIEVEGATEHSSVVDFSNPDANPSTSYLAIHTELENQRTHATRNRIEGPRILVTGPQSSGKTTLARTLTSYATKQGGQPIVVNMNPAEGMLSLPGTLSAGVFATVMDPEAADGWGGTPTSGPSSVPVKLPLVYNFGRENAEDDADFYKELTSKLASAVSGRLSEDPSVKSSGVIVDGPSIDETSQLGMDLISHIVDEFTINIILVVKSSHMYKDLTSRYTSTKTSLGETVHIIEVERSDGAGPRSDGILQRTRESVIKEYFFGESRKTLSPQIQQVDVDSVVIYRVPEGPWEDDTLIREEGGASSPMEHWTLAVMHASPKDPPEVVRAASVMGFVYVADIDEEKGKAKILAPVSGRLGDRPLVWGRWPEPFINLLG